MNEKEVQQFLHNNLRIEVDIDSNKDKLEIRLILVTSAGEDECISSASVYTKP